MVKITTYDKAVDFLKANREYIYSDYFAHYHLIHTIDKLKNKKLELVDWYNVTDDDGSNVLCVWVMGAYFLYARKWNSEVVRTLAEKINLPKFTHYEFCGQRELMKEVFKAANVEGEVFKNRCIEVCSTVNGLNKDPMGQGNNGGLADFDELVQMGIDYNQEEFRGRGSQTPETISATVFSNIQSQTIYTWRYRNSIVSMAQVINEDEDFAMIGGLYTKPEFRGKGFAYFLMHAVTKGLLGAGYQQCGLVSDDDNNITKKIFRGIGYLPVYNWVLIRKEN